MKGKAEQDMLQNYGASGDTKGGTTEMIEVFMCKNTPIHTHAHIS